MQAAAEFWKSALIDADAAAQTAARSFLLKCNRSSRGAFPFGNPVSVSKEHIPLLTQCPYWIAEKSDGIRACVVMTQTLDDRPVAVVMDRSCSMKGFPVHADAALFKGTVLDCELVRCSDGTFRLLAFDACAIGGDTSVADAPLSMRLETIAAACKAVGSTMSSASSSAAVTLLHSHQSTLLSLHAKPMWRLTRPFPDAVGAPVPYGTDGFILTPESDGAPLPGMAPRIFKMKACHTLDFYWDGSTLWIGDDSEKVRAETVGITAFVGIPPHLRSGSIVEMSPVRQPEDGTVHTVEFVAVRQDKTTPNSHFTVVRTLTSIHDAVSLEDLKACFSN